MVSWIAKELGIQIPLHLSRYYPQHKMNISPTPIKTLERLYDIAKQQLYYVFLGNVSDEKRSSSYCIHCGKKLIVRNRYSTDLIELTEDGKCKSCGTPSQIKL